MLGLGCTAFGCIIFVVELEPFQIFNLLGDEGGDGASRADLHLVRCCSFHFLLWRARGDSGGACVLWQLGIVIGGLGVGLGSGLGCWW